MPNLGYDPKNPTDLLDRPIAVGDIVAWGTTYGRSPAVCVARIDDIVFAFQPQPYGDWIKCSQAQAQKYTLRLKPLKSTGSVTTQEFVKTPSGWEYVPIPGGAKVKTVHLVKNIVKLEPINAD